MELKAWNSWSIQAIFYFQFPWRKRRRRRRRIRGESCSERSAGRNRRGSKYDRYVGSTRSSIVSGKLWLAWWLAFLIQNRWFRLVFQMGDTLVKPFVGVIRGGFDTSAFTQRQHKGAEVWAVFTQDLSALSHRDNLSFTQFRSGYSLPIFSARGYRIWGLTAIILHNALKVLVPKIYRPVVRYTRPLV